MPASLPVVRKSLHREGGCTLVHRREADIGLGKKSLNLRFDCQRANREFCRKAHRRLQEHQCRGDTEWRRLDALCQRAGILFFTENGDDNRCIDEHQEWPHSASISSRLGSWPPGFACAPRASAIRARRSARGALALRCNSASKAAITASVIDTFRLRASSLASSWARGSRI